MTSAVEAKTTKSKVHFGAKLRFDPKVHFVFAILAAATAVAAAKLALVNLPFPPLSNSSVACIAGLHLTLGVVCNIASTLA